MIGGPRPPQSRSIAGTATTATVTLRAFRDASKPDFLANAIIDPPDGLTERRSRVQWRHIHCRLERALPFQGGILDRIRAVSSTCQDGRRIAVGVGGCAPPPRSPPKQANTYPHQTAPVPADTVCISPKSSCALVLCGTTVRSTPAWCQGAALCNTLIYHANCGGKWLEKYFDHLSKTDHVKHCQALSTHVHGVISDSSQSSGVLASIRPLPQILKFRLSPRKTRVTRPVQWCAPTLQTTDARAPD